MVGMYVLGVLIVIVIGVLVFFRIKWNRADSAIARARADRIEKQNAEAAAKTEAGGSN
jgi:hypothetical protein